MSSPEPVPAGGEWASLEAWVDPTASPPYVLMLLEDDSGCWRVVDPGDGYRILFSSRAYEDAKNWVIEDEYESVRGRMTNVAEPAPV